MDFALLSTLLPSLDDGISRVLVSYDIGCQWVKNLQSRISQYSISTSLDLSSLHYWKVVVPKFHLTGHGDSCQVIYNLNYTKGVGRTDGERIEGGWSLSSNMAVWTRENGPNARRAILDDHWGSMNWQKLLGLCKCFLIPHNQFTNLVPRCFAYEKPPPVSQMEQDSAGLCISHLCKIFTRDPSTVDKDTRGFRRQPKEIEPVRGTKNS